MCLKWTTLIEVTSDVEDLIIITKWDDYILALKDDSSY